jgi:PD-(D/E)XK nuclease superfamily
MIIELKRRGSSLSIQRAFPVFYRDELIGNLIPDLIVDDAVIVDPKSGGLFRRPARSSNARVSKYHRVGSGPAP